MYALSGGLEWHNVASVKEVRRRSNEEFSTASGFDCMQHGRFKVSGTMIALMASNEWPRRAWERALMMGKGEAMAGALPLITSDHSESALGEDFAAG
jgi:hypothetical protein